MIAQSLVTKCGIVHREPFFKEFIGFLNRLFHR